jgi:hypothetical protein
MTQNTQAKTPGIFRSENFLWIDIITTIVFLIVGQNWLMDLSNPLKYGFLFIWLFIVVLAAGGR